MNARLSCRTFNTGGCPACSPLSVSGMARNRQRLDRDIQGHSPVRRGQASGAPGLDCRGHPASPRPGAAPASHVRRAWNNVVPTCPSARPCDVGYDTEGGAAARQAPGVTPKRRKKHLWNCRVPANPHSAATASTFHPSFRHSAAAARRVSRICAATVQPRVSRKIRSRWRRETPAALATSPARTGVPNTDRMTESALSATSAPAAATIRSARPPVRPPLRTPSCMAC